MKGSRDLTVRLDSAPQVKTGRRGQPITNTTKGLMSQPSPAFGIRTHEWNALFTARANLLLVGDATATSQILGALWPALEEPVWMTAAAPLSLPSVPTGTLIIQNGARLTAKDQRRLLQWLDGYAPMAQIVTTTPKPLVPLVQRGTFLEALYYRLNVMYVELKSFSCN